MAGNVGAGATGLISGITGFFQKKQGNKLNAQNPFPVEGMPSEILANQQIAQGAAQQGLPSEEYQQAQKNIQRNQAAAISSAATSPGDAVRNLGAIQEMSNNATGQLDAQNAEARRQNIGQLQTVNNQVASWKDKLFDWNQRAKYQQDRQYAMSLIGAGNANMVAGADKLIGGLVGAGASGAFAGGGTKPPAPNANAGASSSNFSDINPF